MNVQVPASQLLGTEGEGVAALEACRDRAIGALCAEAVGAMAELNSATLEYTKTRKQFGVDDRLASRCCSTAWSTCSSRIRRRSR